MPSVSNILANAPASIVLSSNAIDRGALFNRKVDHKLPLKIYATYRIIKKIYDYSAAVAVDAVGIVNIVTIADVGDSIEILVNDPELGSISLGTYVAIITDTTTAILAQSIAAEMNSNPYGYGLASVGSDVNITAREGLGNTIDGGGRLTVVIVAVAIMNIIAEGGEQILTEVGSGSKNIIAE